MRLLVLMRGIPGSGKSTFVHDAGLDDYAIEPDRLRLLAASPALARDGTFRVSGRDDSYVWHLVLELAERRMRSGETTVVDATLCDRHDFRRWRTLCRRWRYRCVVVTLDVSVEEALARNASRPARDRVDEGDIRRLAGQLAASPDPPGWCETCPPDPAALRERLMLDFEDAGLRYDRVKVIGDVHGCATALEAAVPEGVGADPRCLYLFCGDLFDRGVESGRLLQGLAPVLSNGNVRIVCGNHELHVANHVMHTEPVGRDGRVRVTRHFRASYSDMCATLGHDETERLLAVLTNRLEPYVAFSFVGRRWLVTHGGLSCVPPVMGLVSERDCVFGVGDYGTPIDQDFEASDNPLGVTQVHGHRRTLPSEHSICLESGVEFGGYLSVLVMDEDGHRIERTRNDVYDHGLRPCAADDADRTSNATTNAIMASPWVRVRHESEHGLVSLAFTQRAFARGHWDEQTTRARGLFVDERTGDVRLRAYDKFFGIGERPETSLHALSRTMRFPAQAWRKENGFLGIMGVVDGDVVLATKGSTTGDYADRFRRVFGMLAPDSRSALSALAGQGGCSLLFEVLATDDEHIIWHGTNELVFLDAVRNSYDVGGTNVDPAFSARVRAFVPTGDPHLRTKSLEADLDGMSDLTCWLSEHAHDRSMEGIVVCDANGLMVKAKLPYYRAVKRLRGAMRLARTQAKRARPMPRSFTTDGDSDEMARVVDLFMSDLLADPCWMGAHVIDAARGFEERHGIDLSRIDADGRW